MKVIKPFLSAAVTMAEYKEGVGKEYSSLYVVDTEEMVFYKRTSLANGGYCLLQVDSIPKAEETKVSHEAISFLPGGKIPGKLLLQIVAFFKKVMEVNFGGSGSRAGENCEAMAHIVWDKSDSSYKVAIPTQKVSKASVNYEFNHIDQATQIIIIDIHSHNTMSAFFSGTDDNDDKKGCWFAGVVGNLDKPAPALKWRFTCFGNFREVLMNSLFDNLPEVIPYDTDFPQEWMGKVTGRYEAPKSFGSTGTGSPYGLGYLYGSRQRHSSDSSTGRDFRQAYEEFEREQRGFLGNVKKKKKFGKDGYKQESSDDPADRICQDAVDAIEELVHPIHSEQLVLIAEALAERVSSGIRRMPVKHSAFLLVLAEKFIEEFSEVHAGEDLDLRSNVPYLVDCMVQHCSWDVVKEIHTTLMDHVETYYEDGADIDLAIDYLEDNSTELSAEQTNRIQQVTENVEICSNETSH